MAIPVISEILQIIIAWIQSAPSWFQLLFFMALISLVVGFIGHFYDTPSFGVCPICWNKGVWDHPRVFQPQECANATRIIKNTTLTNPQDIFYNKNECDTVSNCVNTNNNKSCNCNCIMGAVTECGWLDLSCQSNPTPNETRQPYSLTCSQDPIFHFTNDCAYTITAVNSTQFLRSYCQSNSSEILKYVSLISKCRYAGLDLLNAPILWGVTLLFLCIELVWKVASILGIFQK